MTVCADLTKLALFAILLAASCSGGGSDTSPTFLGRSTLSNPSLTSSSTSTSPSPPSTIPSGPSSGAPPTHDYEGSLEALLNAAVLDGTLDCLWASHGAERTVLVLPEGSRTVQDGAEVVLVDRDGNEIARTGDRIDIVGGFAEGIATCAAADPTTSSFLVGRIERDE